MENLSYDSWSAGRYLNPRRPECKAGVRTTAAGCSWDWHASLRARSTNGVNEGCVLHSEPQRGTCRCEGLSVERIVSAPLIYRHGDRTDLPIVCVHVYCFVN